MEKKNLKSTGQGRLNKPITDCVTDNSQANNNRGDALPRLYTVQGIFDEIVYSVFIVS
jgi:hypothetical protein